MYDIIDISQVRYNLFEIDLRSMKNMKAAFKITRCQTIFQLSIDTLVNNTIDGEVNLPDPWALGEPTESVSKIVTSRESSHGADDRTPRAMKYR